MAMPELLSRGNEATIFSLRSPLPEFPEMRGNIVRVQRHPFTHHSELRYWKLVMARTLKPNNFIEVTGFHDPVTVNHTGPLRVVDSLKKIIYPPKHYLFSMKAGVMDDHAVMEIGSDKRIANQHCLWHFDSAVAQKAQVVVNEMGGLGFILDSDADDYCMNREGGNIVFFEVDINVTVLGANLKEVLIKATNPMSFEESFERYRELSVAA